MKTLLQSLAVGALSLTSLGAIATAPVSAASITGVAIGGSEPTDYYVYDVSGNNTVRNLTPTASDIQNVLGGNAASPTGNVELAASSEQGGFDFTKNTTLSGSIGGKSITLSSLTASDWATANYNGSGKTFGQYWFNQALANNELGALVGTSTANTIFGAFVGNGGFQRFSDPNISYVNQDNTGLIKIGLAGHLNATPLIFPIVPPNLQPFLIGKTIQASEIVKYTYEGKTDYLYSFYATNSGLTAKDDGVSHTGNYEVTLQGSKPVPVPAAFIGIAFAGAIGAARLKRLKVTSKV